MPLRLILVFISLFIIKTNFAITTYNIPRTIHSPTIDGNFSNGEWSAAATVELQYETNPGNSTPAPVKTTAFMMEDGENLYFAFKAYDPQPEKILAFIRDRDGIFQDDFVGVILDTFNDERKGFEFFVNPMGSQGDLTRDDSQSNQEDASWNAVWDSAAQVTDQGYIVEMAIPFRAVRYTSGLEEQTWGIDFIRVYPRDSRFNLSDRKHNRELDCDLCQTNKMKGMPNLQAASTNLDITPTITYMKNDSRDVEPITSWEEIKNEADFGMDLRWAVTEDWIFNATLNPDFSQVEADAGQLDINTTFSLFYPEARPFFLDGADYFNSMNQLVHTRNIADPDYGVKVSGKTNGYSLGAIAASDESTSFLIPSSQSSYVEEIEGVSSDVLIARGLADIGKKNSIGVLMTNRSATGYKNQVLSIDGRHYFTDKDVLSYQYMRSSSDNPDSIRFDDDGEELLAANQDDDALSLNYQHKEEDYYIKVNYNDFGKDFRADMGFISQVNYKKLVVGGKYVWRGDEGNKWTQWGFFGDWDRTEEQSGLKLEEESELHFLLHGPLQFVTNFGYVVRDKHYNGQNFAQEFFMMWVEFKPMPNVTVGNWMRLGDDIDHIHTQEAKSKRFEPYLDWQIGKHLSAEINYYAHFLDVSSEQLYQARLFDIRLAYQFSNRSRLSLTVQSTDIERNVNLYADNQDADPDNDVYTNEKDLGLQLIYSYKINPQTLVYVGYSDNAIEHDNIQSLEKTDRALFAKFSYLWQM